MGRIFVGSIRTFGRLAACTVGVTLAFVCFGSSAQANTLTVTSLAGDGSAGSLVAAINAANANPSDSDTITFAANVTGTITPAADLPALVGPTEISGPGSAKLTIDGGGTRSLLVTDKDLKVSGLTLTHGTNVAGGAINAIASNLQLSDVTIKDNNAADGKGGGLYLSGGALTVSNSTISGNKSTLGGGMWIGGASVSITGTSITSNIAVFKFSPHVDGAGGGLFVDSGTTVDLKDSTVNENKSDDGAAFVFLDAGDVTISNSTFKNDTGYDGLNNQSTYGTASIKAAKATITDSEFTGGASTNGAGLTVYGDATIDSCLIANNQSGGLAGLLLGTQQGQPKVDVTLSNSTITGNTATVSGAGVLTSNADVSIDSTTITGNKVSFPTFPEAAGSGLLTLFGTATLTNSIVSGNSPLDVTAARDYPTFPGIDAQGHVKSSFSLLGITKGRSVEEPVPASNIQSTTPKLGALADNGGPVQTMLPADDSPAVNIGLTGLTTDARGLPRPVKFVGVPLSTFPQANGADMGAVELQNPPNDFTFGKVKVNRKKGLATVQIKVPGAGKVLLLGSGTVKKASKPAKKKSTVTLTVKAKGKAAKQLKKKGKTKVKAMFKFTPTRGLPKQKSKTVKLVKTKTGKGSK